MENTVELIGWYGGDLELVKNIEGQPFKHTLEAWGY